MKRTPAYILPLAMLLFVATISTLRADERLQNGGFESGSFSPGWTASDPNPPPPFVGVGSDSAFAHSGNNYAYLGSSPLSGTLTQTFSTVAGAMYQISFWLATYTGTPPSGMPSNSFLCTFNGMTVASLSNNMAAGYTQYTAMFTAAGNSSTLQFTFRNDDDYFNLDDVSVNGPSPVPDQGSTFWLAFPAFGALLLTHRLNKKMRQATA